VIGTGELARACQTTVRTVRFYEETGLVEPLDRKDGAHRVFRKDTEARLRLIMDLREAGLSLQEIKELFALKQESRTAHEAAHRMGDAIAKRADALQEKIAVLRRLRDDLAAMSAVLHECEPCNEARFPERCPSCDVMTRPDLPRAMRLLWGPAK
jgi:DNA-binding transcriptional MerR regulator